MSVLTIVGFIGGLALLVVGANLLVKGSSGIARRFGISSLVIGLTVVAYGTSSPEMAVSVAGAAGDNPGVALGNVLGSTVANVLLILGISALFGPMLVQRRLIRIEVPIMVGLVVVTYFLAWNEVIGRVEGVLLFLLAIAYTVFTIRTSRKDPEEQEAVAGREESPKRQHGIGLNIVFALIGLGTLVGGSQLMVNSAVDIASALGLSDVIIGLTVVAVGTSLPEIATSIAAAIKGDRDLAVGNVVGSNIFNMTAVLGLSGMAASNGLPVPESMLSFDFPVMLAVCIACLPIFFTGHVIMRWEGVVFLAYYAAYVAYLVLSSTDRDRAEQFNFALIAFVIPLTVITFLVLVVREVRGRMLNRPYAAPEPQ